MADTPRPPTTREVPIAEPEVVQTETRREQVVDETRDVRSDYQPAPAPDTRDTTPARDTGRTAEGQTPRVIEREPMAAAGAQPVSDRMMTSEERDRYDRERMRSSESDVTAVVDIGRLGRRFGGIDIVASLLGMLVAFGFLLIVGGIAAAIFGLTVFTPGSTATTGGATTTLTAAGATIGTIILFLAYLLGGWAAARISRFFGWLNGLLTAVWSIILIAILGGLGAWVGSQWNVFNNIGLGQWYQNNTTGTIVGGIIAAVVMLGAGALGGRLGEPHHFSAPEAEEVISRRQYVTGRRIRTI